MFPKKVVISLACFLGLLTQVGQALAQESLCAQVKLQIEQELTLERQAFEAHMRINNGLDTDPLENVAVSVQFTDKDGNPVVASSDPDSEDATFFIRQDSLDGIDAVDGTGTVMPSTSADIHWQIIPSPGAAGQVSDGKLFFVGATLEYDLAGEHHETDVAPDSITVKPLPLLTLDYFLKEQVYADDPFTEEEEPAEPFTLGVRIRNNGSGPAESVSIDSAQPEIVANEQGLDISFEILESYIQNEPAEPTLLLDFGRIPAGEAMVGRWRMVTDLSGRFTDFDASFSHSDELGGSLTSVIDAVNTHFLVRDVLVDLSGRDAVRDFLARDGDFLTVYESNGTDSEVADLSADAALERTKEDGDRVHHRFTVPEQDGFIHARVRDPYLGQKEIEAVYRSDGKEINARNAWLARERNDDLTWDYGLHLFDANTTGSYTVVMKAPDIGPVAPEIAYIPPQVVVETETLAFGVEAADANGDPITLSVDNLPEGAGFTDNGDGTGTFEWTPELGQQGTYNVTFRASDGELESTRSAPIEVRWIHDRDGDGMKDEWELEHFGTLDRDGTGDYDGDGYTDLEEYEEGMDPTRPPGPGEPEPKAPEAGSEVTTQTPELTLINSEHSDLFDVTYEFEVYADAEMSERVAHVLDVPEAEETTSWTVSPALTDNHWFHWRARAFGADIHSEWVGGTFFVNTENDAPGEFAISGPADGTFVDTFTPVLEVTNSTDVDEDALTYDFAVYVDEALTQEVAATTGVSEGDEGTTAWTVPDELTENTWYHWRATAVDEHGAETAGPVGGFFVNTRNDAPTAPAIEAPVDGVEVTTLDVDLLARDAEDPEMEPVTYHFQLDRTATFDSDAKRTSGGIPEGDRGTAAWPVSGLADNTEYFWRVKASDGEVDSPWTAGSFFVNQFNDPPTVPTPANPGQGGWVGTLQPTLQVNPSRDVDRDELHYEFELYAPAKKGGLGERLAAGESGEESWRIDSPVPESGWYYWRARAVDEHGLASDWMDFVVFYADADGVNDEPVMRLHKVKYDLPGTVGGGNNGNGQRPGDGRGKQPMPEEEPEEPAEREEDEAPTKEPGAPDKNHALLHWYDRDPDSNATIDHYYDRDGNGGGRGVIVEGLKEDPDGRGDRYLWDLSGLEDGVYFPYAVIDDGNTRKEVRAPNEVVIGDGGGQPFIRLKGPNGAQEKEPGDRVHIRWKDLDADDNARITLSYRPVGGEPGEETVIVGGLEEDPDRQGDSYKWRLPDLPAGKYRIVARITDGKREMTDASDGYVEVPGAEE
ncbi:Ig-like domain-containing protein [Thiohalorhabdus denitrificans]|uniref:Ig-like domain (Group 3) n=1 Tax=Thiohalorhabdus denitrificans TaxID=381306 RepID=A0A1G5DUT0_9GAMM|nr:Ig-like domain-containing protein [Thiohalorhabdus denitrificans]SCY18539.1 hypothetical protein SAMN05661077_1477 [Thiohalorhabdus denitrificans]